MKRSLVLAAFLVAACKPHPTPAPPADSTASDSGYSAGDTLTVPDDTNGVGTELPDSVIDAILHKRGGLRGAAPITGIAYGLSDVSSSEWCGWALNGMFIPFTPTSGKQLLQVAAACGKAIFMVPARRFLTTGGDVHQPFSLAKANAFCDDAAKVLTASVVQTYRKNLAGLNLADDYGSKDQWGGQVVTQAQIAAWGAHCKEKMPYVNFGIRVEPTWANAAVAKSTDYAWAQYRTYKGEVHTYFNKQQISANNLGLKLVTAVNVRECGVQGSAPCTPTQLRLFGDVAVRLPIACAMVSWKYDDGADGNTWTRDLQAVHSVLAGTARGRPTANCIKGTSPVAVVPDSTPDSTVLDTTPVAVAADSTDSARQPAETAFVPPGHRKHP